MFCFTNLLDSVNPYGRGFKILLPFFLIISSYVIKIIHKEFYFILIFLFTLNITRLMDFKFPNDYSNYLINKGYIFNNKTFLSGKNIDPFNNSGEYAEYTLFNCQRLIPPFNEKIIHPTNTWEIIETENNPYSYVPYQFIHYDYKSRYLVNRYSTKFILVKN